MKLSWIIRCPSRTGHVRLVVAGLDVLERFCHLRRLLLGAVLRNSEQSEVR